MQRWAGSTFPVGTFKVNVVGWDAVGVVATGFAGPGLGRGEYRLGLLVGVLGGFTTFSSVGWETFSLMNEGQLAAAAANFVMNNAVGFAAVWAGFATARRLYGA